MSMLIQVIDLDGPVLLVLGHTAMIAAMLVAMLVRHDEYAGREDHAGASPTPLAADLTETADAWPSPATSPTPTPSPITSTGRPRRLGVST